MLVERNRVSVKSSLSIVYAKIFHHKLLHKTSLNGNNILSLQQIKSLYLMKQEVKLSDYLQGWFAFFRLHQLSTSLGPAKLNIRLYPHWPLY